MSQSPIVIVGAGYVGKRVLHCLDGARKIALGRSSGFDLDREQALPVTLPDTYSLLYTVPPSPDHADDVRLQALLNMLQQPPQRFVYISTTGVYGDHKGAAVDESSGLYAESARAKRRLSAESILTPWAQQHGVALSILRTPGIYGPARLGIERLRERVPMTCERDAHPGNRIHVDDLVRCCIAALRGDAPAGIYNVGDGDHRSPTAFAKEVARQAGLDAPPEISREGVAKVATESRLVDTTRMREQLGVIPKYANAVDGIRASLKISSDG